MNDSLKSPKHTKKRTTIMAGVPPEWSNAQFSSDDAAGQAMPYQLAYESPATLPSIASRIFVNPSLN